MVDLTEVKDIAIADCSDRYTYNGKNVPRVTEILSKMIHEDYLMYWANNLGFSHRKYEKVLFDAANFGTKAHYGIECFLKEKDIPLNTPMTPIDSFRLWWEAINKNNNVEVVAQEQKLVCEWFGGTYDLLLKINGCLFLVDFKTSNHVTYKYYMQLSAYSYMLKKQGIYISGVIILQLNKTSPGYNEFVLDFSNKKDKDYFEMCEKTFLALVYGYYHIHWLEEEFKNGVKAKIQSTRGDKKV